MRIDSIDLNMVEIVVEDTTFVKIFFKSLHQQHPQPLSNSLSLSLKPSLVIDHPKLPRFFCCVEKVKLKGGLLDTLFL
nr:hypothetical protein CFP56_47961 [Quercus suber]